jgi:hypothetical protein
MVGNNPPVNPLQSRKRLLVAESEINRVQLGGECRAMTDGIRSLAVRLKTVSALASAAAVLVAGVSAFRRRKSASASTKPSWFQFALKGAQMAVSIWLAVRARPR